MRRGVLYEARKIKCARMLRTIWRQMKSRHDDKKMSAAQEICADREGEQKTMRDRE